MESGGANGDSIEKLRGLQISPPDDEDEEEQKPEAITIDENDYDDEDDDDEDDEPEPIILGFLEKPKNRWSLLRQLFPSKAGGVPVFTFL